ncbi:MAG: hypothetical protein ACK5N8_06815 [Alphaproteobacteria bacterium]
MENIAVELDEFLLKFPYFVNKNISQVGLDAQYPLIGTYISTKYGEIILDRNLQKQGVYLAMAHIMYLQLNPSSSRPVSNVSQGSESAGFEKMPTNDWLEYVLGATMYGRDLILILRKVQPKMAIRPSSIYPYYGGF